MHSAQFDLRKIIILSIYLLLLMVVITTHTYILYGHLSYQYLLIQSLLRFFTAIAPILLTIYISRFLSHSLGFYALLTLWIFIIPYSLYNFFQIRHIAEIFRLSPDLYFTSSAFIADLWKLFPVSAYAFSQLLTFIYCNRKISILFYSKLSQIKFVFTIIFYSSIAALLGITTRLDTFHIIIHPVIVINKFIGVFQTKASLINLFAIYSFALMLFFGYAFFIEWNINSKHK